MVFKRYQVQILFRLLLLVVNCFGIAYVWQLQDYWVSFYNLILLLILQVYLLFKFLTRWQKDIRVFASSVKHNDYTITYSLVENDPYHELYSIFNNISQYVRGVKSQFVQQNQYFQYVVESAQVGLIAYDSDGKIVLNNDESLKLFQTLSLKNIHDLKKIDGIMYDHLITLGLNQSKLIVSGNNRNVKLSARLSKFVIDNKVIFLLSLVNIKPELEQNELQSWQELISVLTHEIMNSVTPIHSLNGSMVKYLDRIEGNEEIIAKARHGLDVINRRSLSLMNFVDRYRKMSAIPLPHIQEINIQKTINGILTLLEEDLKDIQVNVYYAHEIVKADSSLLEQVLINIIRNAAFSFEEDKPKRIFIRVNKNSNRTFIVIEDTGKCIPPSVIDKIFIPFFTTRSNGSGIGLTLSRQIMHRHDGTIEVSSEPGKGTVFTLIFPD